MVKYGQGFGFLGFYIARPEIRGKGYGIRVWRAGMARLQGRNVGLDGVVAQQDNYRKSGFRLAWNNIRHEGAPPASTPPAGVALVDGGEVACAPLVRATGGKSRLQMALRLLKDRRDRHKFFSATLFGEPVWDILLDLYVRGASNQPTSVTSACIASGVPATTALRYIRLLERQGLVARRADAADARRNFLELSPRGQALLDNYLDEISR